jgi:hypothetical protein
MKLIGLFEDIFRSLSNPGLLSLSVNTHEKKHRSSDRESITTATPLPLRMTASKTRGAPVYYAYNYLHSDEVTELLKAIKGKGTLKVDDRQLNRFFDDTVAYMVTGLKQRKIKPDVVVCPASSAPITKEFAMRLAHGMHDVKIVTDAFLKQKAFKLPEDKAAALKVIADKFVDRDLVQAKYHGDDVEKFVNRIALSVYSSIKKYGTLELKGIDKQVGKFIKGFMDKGLDVEYELMDKEVLVVDDVLSSGSTMSEMMRLVKDECLAKTVNGAVIFNMTTAPASKA